MSTVTKVVYQAGNFESVLSTPREASTIFESLKSRFPELSNGEYTVQDGTMTVTLRSGSKA